MEEPPQDPTLPTPPAAQRPGAAWSQLALRAPQGPVTLLSKLAGIIIMLSGLAMAVIAVTFVVHEAASSYAELALYVGVVIFVVAVVELLGGIGILRGLGLARAIGIIYSLLLACVSFWLALGNNGPPIAAGAAPIFGFVFVLYAYSAVVLIARWREPATA